MNLSPSTLKGALLDAQQGNGLVPSTSQTLIDQGWAEWVDYEFGTPIDENSPRSLMRLTTAGHEQLVALEGTPIEQPTVTTKPIPKQPSGPPSRPVKTWLTFAIRFRSHVAA
ncbi:hypothetical protein [Variovorax rhizosphaerae]|uniref:Uncharacterized protein n=1 Tax=Variovorax rhizosphaerae TaxID=1836200 RepID=A0ABU8WKF1_9BURK